MKVKIIPEAGLNYIDWTSHCSLFVQVMSFGFGGVFWSLFWIIDHDVSKHYAILQNPPTPNHPTQ